MAFLDLLRHLHSRFVFSRRIDVLAATIAPLLPAGRILDVGCGDGSMDALIMQQRADVEIKGVEVMERPKSLIPVTAYDGVHLPFPDASFDGVMLLDVLHHADDCEKLLRECARVAGVVVIKDHISNNLMDHWLLKLMDWVGNRPYGVALPYNYLSSESWTAMYREVGLQVEVTAKPPAFHPFPLSLVLGRRLHFVAALRRNG